ncbi:MAG: hypothetical protein CML30_11570 [Rhizobiales bacterium]|nr:hypothetical protein [Hyphomicrobiales bacterium]
MRKVSNGTGMMPNSRIRVDRNEIALKANPEPTEEPPMTSAGRTIKNQSASVKLRTLAFAAAAAVSVLALAELAFLATGEADAFPVWAMILAAGSVLTAVGLWIGLNRMGQRIDQLADAVETVIQGRYDIEVPRVRFPLLGPLADRIGALAQKLAATSRRDRRYLEINPVTDLPRRAVLKDRVEKDMAVTGAQGGLIHIEIVNRKQICARYGPSIAEPLLGAIARTLAAATPVGSIENNAFPPQSGEMVDALPLLGHAESAAFVVHLPGFSSADALERQATQILAAFAEPLAIGERRVSVEIAIGIARYTEDGGNFEEVANKAALAAAHAASPSSPDCMILYDKRLMAAISERDGLEQELRQAISDKQIDVCYQPKVHAADWSSAGVEALVRWNHPTRGMVDPCEFIPLAEASGLIVELGMFVISKATAQCAEWSRKGRLIGISVNVAAGQVARPDFAEKVLEIVSLNDCPPTLLTIEITETMAHTHNERFVEQLDRLRAAGLQLAIDDFGIGYSNLAHLAELQFDALKIDRSLVNGLETSSRMVEVCRAIVNLGKALGCKIVAEGVETPGQVAAASALGCDEVQGYYISAALNADEFIEWHERLHARNLANIVRDVFGEEYAPADSGAGRPGDPEPPEVGLLKLFSGISTEKPGPKKRASG